VTVPNMPEFTYPLVAAKDVAEMGLGGRIMVNLNRMVFGQPQQPQPQ
jgi:hypothetical protein